MRVFNRKARRNYKLLEKLEAGVALAGAEAKSVREGRISLDEAFVRIRQGEVFLYNAQVSPYQPTASSPLDPRRPRKLLLHKAEILALEQKARQKRLTIVPIACYTRGRNIKLEIALAKGKKEYEKREVLKRKDLEKEIAWEVRGKA